MGLLSAWLYADDDAFDTLLADTTGRDPRPLLGGLTYLAATAVQAYAQAMGLEPAQVLRLLGGITARRA